MTTTLENAAPNLTQKHDKNCTCSKCSQSKKKTFKINLFNDPLKGVEIVLTKQQIKLLIKIFNFKCHSEIQEWFLRDAEKEFPQYESFKHLKEDYENYIDEIIDVTAMGRCMYFDMTNQKPDSFFEAVNRLATSHQYLAHYKEGDPRIEQAQRKVFDSHMRKATQTFSDNA